MNGLLTDLYQLTMAAGYMASGKMAEIGTFELTLRRLPRNRDFVVFSGLHRAVEYLLHLGFDKGEIDYLQGLPSFRKAPPEFWDYLAAFRFTGDLFAVPEGTILHAGQPVLNIRGPLIEAQIPETYLLASITFETLIATKAALIVHAAAGKPVIEFGTRRAHTPEAGVLGARAAYIAGCAGTSNVLAGYRYGVPVMGTAAHSWVMSFESEIESFRELQKLLGDQTVHLIDTYDPIAGTHAAARTGRPMWGVRLDSGNLPALSKEVRGILDRAGLKSAKIMASGDLDENKIAAIIAAGAPIDAFGVGTELATSSDAPSMGAIYKLVEIERAGTRRYTAKSSEDKRTLPGAKQLFRHPDHDVLGLSDENVTGAEALLQPVILEGRLVRPLPMVEDARARAAAGLKPWPQGRRRTLHTPALEALFSKVYA